MDPTVAALIGVALGAFAGLAGAGLAAVASLRASQLAARVPLAEKLHRMGRAFVELEPAIGTKDEAKAGVNLNVAWNDFFTHQRILCPSERLQEMGTLFFRLFLRMLKPQTVQSRGEAIKVAGAAQETIAKMVSAYSNHLFQRQARHEELKVLQEFLDTPDAQALSPDITAGLRRLR